MFRSLSNTTRAWVLFLTLGCFAWGTSFLWIKIGLSELDAYNLVLYRLLFAFIGLWLLVWFLRIPLPRDWRTIGWMTLIGVVNTALPFTSIAWGTRAVSSSLSSILNASTPLYSTLLAHFLVAGERLTWRRVLGVLLGFLGVAVLSSAKDSTSPAGFQLLPILAIQLGSLLYAVATIITRKTMQGQHPIATSSIAVTSALFCMILIVNFISHPVVPQKGLSWLAVAWLGLIGTAFAYAIYFDLIKLWGPARSTMVTYLVPAVAVILGVLFLREEFHWQILAGGAMILGGVMLVQGVIFNGNPGSAK